ncbi:hypothetical protein ELG74_26565 (plasmid) [Rhizobium leguminosarum]|nr:hypothetical protein ELG74_26565 [Rhizobium leguminosarum]
MFAAETEKTVKHMPPRPDLQLQSISSESSVLPSSGLMAITYVIEEVSKTGTKISWQARDRQRQLVTE